MYLKLFLVYTCISAITGDLLGIDIGLGGGGGGGSNPGSGGNGNHPGGGGGGSNPGGGGNGSHPGGGGDGGDDCDDNGNVCIRTETCSGCGPKRSNKCYNVVCYMTANWVGALTHCNLLGMRLATVENENQHVEILKAIDSSACSNQFMWIGGTNLADGSTYVWSPTGKLVNYKKFTSGEPNNNGGSENCLEYRNCGWNDRACGVRQQFICESVAEVKDACSAK